MVTILLLFSSLIADAKKISAEIKSIHLEEVKSLTIEKPLEPGRRAHVSAASGIVLHNGRYFFVPDDEFAVFEWDQKQEHLTPFKLSDVQLGAQNDIRKKMKPDLESLLELGKDLWPPNGALVGWPSSSEINRNTAYIIPFGDKDQLLPPLKVDVLPLFKKLSKFEEKINIEGISIHENKVYLFQRGNGKGIKSGYFVLDLKGWLSGVQKGEWSDSIDFKKIKIGKLTKAKVTLADGAWLDDGVLGLAPAEDTLSTYRDGKIEGTLLVYLQANSSKIVGRFDKTVKLEGIVAEKKGEKITLHLVDDADDPEKPSHLFKATLTPADLR